MGLLYSSPQPEPIKSENNNQSDNFRLISDVNNCDTSQRPQERSDIKIILDMPENLKSKNLFIKLQITLETIKNVEADNTIPIVIKNQMLKNLLFDLKNIKNE